MSMTEGGVATGSPVETRGGELRLRAAFFVSSCGDWIYRLAVPLLVLRITGSAASTAFSYALEFVPYVALGLVAGVIADRHDRRNIMVLCDAASTVVAVAIAVLAALPHPPVVGLYAAVFVLASLRPFYFPAFQGLIVDAVPTTRLPRLNSWTQTVDSLLGMAGPVAGTALVGALGVSVATGVNAASFAVSAVLVAAIRHRPASRLVAGAGGIGRDFVTGVRVLLSAPAMVWGTVLIAVLNLAVFMVEANLFYAVLHVEHRSKLALGLVFGAQGLGAVGGAWLAQRLIHRHPTGVLLSAGMAGSTLALALPAVLPLWSVLVAAWTVQGVATSVTIVAWVTARQRIIPSSAMGRVTSVSRAFAYTTIPIGALAGGWLIADVSSVRNLFVAAAAFQLVAFVGTLLTPLGRIHQQPMVSGR